MSHKISLSSLVLEFKRATDGEGAAANNKLGVLVAFSLAYCAPLPNNGKFGSLHAYNTIMQKHITAIISDVNELMHVDIGSIQDVGAALYENRYGQVYGDEIALETYSVSQIIEGAFGESVVDTVKLWAPRFLAAVKHYIEENAQIEAARQPNL